MIDNRENILKWREELYNETRLLCIDDEILLKHLKKEYESADLDKLVDRINDILLDSFGS